MCWMLFKNENENLLDHKLIRLIQKSNKDLEIKYKVLDKNNKDD